MNDVTLTDQYDFLQFNLSSLAVTISAPQLHYNALATFAFSVLLGDMSNDQGKYPIVVSFKPHRRNPVGQIRNGDRDHTTDFIGCQYIQIQGEYNAHPEVSDDVSDSIYLSIGIDSPRIIFYGEVYFHIFNLIDNLLGTSQYVITEEEYAAMNNNNRMSFYLKYLDDFRKHKVNIVGAVILFFYAAYLVYDDHVDRSPRRASRRAVYSFRSAVHAIPPRRSVEPDGSGIQQGQLDSVLSVVVQSGVRHEPFGDGHESLHDAYQHCHSVR